ncbi:hypothetical protein D9619_004453 [Psilocybe cf. subviscida]|uniref:ATP-dependent RNA helicase n=1 Tax=Psilocybe cf. subviscida TaxID=2480587 RepID=A0A8H5BNX8_9AGAR|nr:hypothetical protein D9619_004453 [Psilocybe cf. subviscida]
METGPKSEASQPPREKTKAKQRYLKKKKERRKIKTKQHAPAAEYSTTQNHSTAPEEDEDESMDVDMTVVAGPSTPNVLQTNRKRSRQAEEDEDEEETDDEDLKENDEDENLAEEDVEIAVNTEKLSSARRSPTPDLSGALPSFPLPALPDAPSKSLLTMQGLTKELIEAELVLPSTVLLIPAGKDDGGTRLSEKLRNRLRDIGITELFAVQTALLPFLLPPTKALYSPFNPPQDVCVSAPTGSGKTLAYVLPIIETLTPRIVTRLRALIVLPTRDLVAQVRETIEVLSKGTKLKVGTATGQHSFAQEQSQLVQDPNTGLQGGSSKVDILICTPGRLIDHIVGTPNLSLQHLRFLVIDEADRLLAQSFQGWLAQVLAATHPGSAKAIVSDSVTSSNSLMDFMTPDGLAPTFSDGFPSNISSFFLEPKESSCQKLLFSATLTSDPGKITSLNLRKPKYFIVQGRTDKDSDSDLLDVVMEKFTMPETLKEHMIVTESSQKPLMFFHLVHAHEVTNALVFTKSAESTTRLVRLFDFFEDEQGRANKTVPLVARAYSSDLPANERKSILEQFKSQKIHILVCSDLISRGIDISHVSHVVSYDVPVDMRKYVHRVGRTARAGREGDAWTLVEEQEARYFKQMLKQASHLDRVKRLRVSGKDVAPLNAHYELALGKLRDMYSRQK